MNLTVGKFVWRRVASIGAAALMVVLLAASSGKAHSGEITYSYLQMAAGGHHITNFVRNAKYKGWLQVETVQAWKAGASEPPEQSDDERWTTPPPFLRAQSGGAGILDFVAGDDGPGLNPLLNAQKHHTPIDHAELDLYALFGGAFLGKFQLKGIRVVSVEDVPASACPEYLIQISFRSFTREPGGEGK